MSTNRYAEHPFKVGDTVVFSAAAGYLDPKGLQGFHAGDVVTVTDVIDPTTDANGPTDDNLLVRVNDGLSCWNVDWFDLVTAEQREIASLKGQLHTMTEIAQNRDDLLSNMRAQRDAETERADAAEENYREETTRLLDVAGKRDTLLAETVTERGVLADVLQYALGHMDSEDVQRVLGYWDGVKA